MVFPFLWCWLPFCCCCCCCCCCRCCCCCCLLRKHATQLCACDKLAERCHAICGSSLCRGRMRTVACETQRSATPLQFMVGATSVLSPCCWCCCCCCFDACAAKRSAGQELRRQALLDATAGCRCWDAFDAALLLLLRESSSRICMNLYSRVSPQPRKIEIGVRSATAAAAAAAAAAADAVVCSPLE